MLRVMTPLLGTKNPSAPVGDAPAGDGRAARSLLSCALWRGMGRLWRGMGGMGRPEPLSAHRRRRQQGLSGFQETRDTGLPGAPRGVPSGPARMSEVFKKHETRDTNHGFYRRTVAAFLRVVAQRLRRYGVAMERLWRVWGGYGDGAAWAAVERHGRQWSGMGGSGAAWAAYCPRASVPAPVSLSRSALRLACMSHHVAR